MAIVRPKEAYHERTSVEMQKHLRVPDWSIRQKIALALTGEPLAAAHMDTSMFYDG